MFKPTWGNEFDTVRVMGSVLDVVGDYKKLKRGITAGSNACVGLGSQITNTKNVT